MRTGVELEYWVTDGNGKLRSAEKIASRLDFAEREFVEPVLEIKTEPRETVSGLRNEIKRKLKNAIEEAESLDLNIVGLGTPLHSGEIKTDESARSRLQEKIVGERLNYAKHVAGTHFHFEQTDPVKQINLLTALDPSLSLVSSSPYYRGKRVADNARNQIYRYRCYEKLSKHGQLWNYTSSREEWENRIETRFNEFKDFAQEKGIDGSKIEEHFRPEDSIWIPVRLREKFGTVEWRSPDSALPGRIIELLEKIRHLVEKTGDSRLETGKPGIEPGRIVVPEFTELDRLSRNAIYDGQENGEVRRYLEELGFEKQDSVSREIDAGASIDRETAKKIRLKYSKKLKQDVKKL